MLLFSLVPDLLFKFRSSRLLLILNRSNLLLHTVTSNYKLPVKTQCIKVFYNNLRHHKQLKSFFKIYYIVFSIYQDTVFIDLCLFQCYTEKTSIYKKCGPMPNVMVALPNEYRWHPLFNTPKVGWSSLLKCHAVMLPRCETRWKLQRCPQTTGPISAASGPKFTILWGLVKEILLLNKFFPIVDACLSCEDIAQQSCAMVRRWRFFASFLHSVFPESHVQHISDLHSKFALGPRHVWKYGRHPICGCWD